MKKRALAFLIVLVMLLTLPAYGAQPRALQIYPTLSFSGTTATCRVTVIGDNTTDEISADIELWHGSKKVESWSADGLGYLNFSDTATVTAGETYVLKVYVTYNGVSKPMVSVSKDCPSN